MIPMNVNALEVARPANATATLADLLQMQTHMDQAHNKQHTALDLKIDALAVTTADKFKSSQEQTHKQIQTFENSLADLMTLNHTISGNIQKLTNAPAGRNAPIEKKTFVFRGKCFNCEKEGHRATQCPNKPRRKMVNALSSSGKPEDHSKFEEQFGTTEVFIGCLMCGVDEEADSDAAGAPHIENNKTENFVTQAREACISTGTRQLVEWGRGGPPRGDVTESAERGLCRDRWTAIMRRLVHWVRQRDRISSLTCAVECRNTPSATEKPAPSIPLSLDTQVRAESTNAITDAPSMVAGEESISQQKGTAGKTEIENFTDMIPTPKAKINTYMVVPMRGNQMGLLPYCNAGKPTAVDKKQLRYALACIPWKAKGGSPKDVERQFTALSH